MFLNWITSAYEEYKKKNSKGINKKDFTCLVKTSIELLINQKHNYIMCEIDNLFSLVIYIDNKTKEVKLSIINQEEKEIYKKMFGE